MSDGDSIAQLAVVILLLVLAVPALATAHDYAGTPLEYAETATIDYSSDYSVSENATDTEHYGAETTVTVDGTQLVEGTDYDWDATDGNITWYNTTNTSSGDNARVEYRAHQRTEETALAWSTLSPLMGLFGIYAVIASVRALWAYVAEVWDLT